MDGTRLSLSANDGINRPPRPKWEEEERGTCADGIEEVEPKDNFKDSWYNTYSIMCNNLACGLGLT